MPTAPPTLTAAPTSPDRADRATFAARAVALDDFTKNTQIPELQAALDNVYANSVEAQGSATAAAASQADALNSANIAVSAAGAAIWVSGTTYAIGDVRYSPANGSIYRRKTVGAGTTDPSADATNWQLVELLAPPLPTIRPTLLLDFANSGKVSQRITFTRASAATRTNSKGLIETVASGAPRIDYDPVTMACKGLLIEEARTNLLTYSEQFDNAAWTKFRASVTANATTAPDGTTTADKLVEDNTANNTHYLQQSSSATNGATYTVSAHAKAAERTQCKLVLYGASEVYGAVFDLSAGTLAAQSGTGSYTIYNVGNGWYRVTITAVCNATTCYGLYYTATGGTATYTGDGTSGLYIWGAQLEAGAFPTSYIPTVASQVTRAADVASMTGANFSNWYRQDEGAFVAASQKIASQTASTFPFILSATDGTSANEISLLWATSLNKLYGAITVSSSAVADIGTSGLTQTSSNSAALAYKLNDAAISTNGAAVSADTSCTVPTVDRLSIGNRNGSSVFSGHIARLAYYPKRLTNVELQALSA